MTGVLVAGLVAGYGIAMPVGAIGALLVSLGARGPLRLAVVAALAVAVVDGGYALLAVGAGGAVADALDGIARPMEIAAGVVLLGVAAWIALSGWRAYRADRRSSPDGSLRTGAPPRSAARTFAVFVGLTAVNPATVVYFTALVLGRQAADLGSATRSAAFVVAVLVASASWQLLLVGGGAALGRVLAGARARLATALVAALVIAALAARTMGAG
jgi:arginine exporter protein ArgO